MMKSTKFISFQSPKDTKKSRYFVRLKSFKRKKDSEFRENMKKIAITNRTKPNKYNSFIELSVDSVRRSQEIERLKIHPRNGINEKSRFSC